MHNGMLVEQSSCGGKTGNGSLNRHDLLLSEQGLNIIWTMYEEAPHPAFTFYSASFVINLLPLVATHHHINGPACLQALKFKLGQDWLYGGCRCTHIQKCTACKYDFVAAGATISELRKQWGK